MSGNPAGRPLLVNDPPVRGRDTFGCPGRWVTRIFLGFVLWIQLGLPNRSEVRTGAFEQRNRPKCRTQFRWTSTAPASTTSPTSARTAAGSSGPPTAPSPAPTRRTFSSPAGRTDRPGATQFLVFTETGPAHVDWLCACVVRA